MCFPEDLGREILSKLPSFESAARLSCVCKSWYEWIRDNQRRDFGDELSSQIRSGCLMVLHRRGGRYQIRSHNSENILALNLPQDLRLKVVGECNGILCFQDLDQLVSLHLYNPITREYRKLPQGKCYQREHQVFGFGFNTRDNDYNIIRIYECELRKKVMVDIYELSTNRWSWSNIYVDCGLDCNNFSVAHVYVNGSCYWLYHVYGIATFDLERETFGLIDGLPSICDGIPDLGVLDDSLALWSLNRHDKITEVWVLSKYRNKKHWTKKFTVKSPFNGVAAWFYDTDFFQLKPNGELVTLLTREEREAQNGGTRMFKANDWLYTSVVFKPTLVSLSSK